MGNDFKCHGLDRRQESKSENIGHSVILGPGWWNDKLVFSDTRLGKVFSWDPTTQLVGVEVELAGTDNRNTGVWMEPFSNGLKYNPYTDELLICEHGNRGISGR